jgi:fucokinase
METGLTLCLFLGGLAAGRNEAFMPAFDMLDTQDYKSGAELMAAQRSLWLSSPEALIRAARHYESAAQILIRHAVRFLVRSPLAR